MDLTLSKTYLSLFYEVRLTPRKLTVFILSVLLTLSFLSGRETRPRDSWSDFHELCNGLLFGLWYPTLPGECREV